MKNEGIIKDFVYHQEWLENYEKLMIITLKTLYFLLYFFSII
jgi:hypothetical protein